jgi:thymidylate synthase ThyX
MSYSARVLADSVSPDGVRLTTLEITFPRFILAEMNTHRMLSRNSASSRAIPTEKLIERVRNDPFVPETFNKRVKGMGVGDPLDRANMKLSRKHWVDASQEACRHAQALVQFGVDKSRANRLLEPFMWHTAIISATEWENFFALRDHPAAQPEMQIIANLMREAMELSDPQQLEYGWWHLPLLTDEELKAVCSMREAGSSGPLFDRGIEMWKMVSASRCARVSFDKHTDTEPIENTIARAEKLMNSVPAHLSPFEHVATPLTPELWAVEGGSNEFFNAFVGNFRGWLQMRKEIAHEDNALRMIEAAAKATPVHTDDSRAFLEHAKSRIAQIQK